MNTIQDIIERRVNSTGVSEPQSSDPGHRPGRRRAAGRHRRGRRSRKLVGQTGQLEFVPLPPAEYGTASTNPSGPTGITQGQPLPDDPTLEPLFGGDQVTSATAGDRPERPPVVDFDAQVRRRASCSATTPPTTSATSSRSSSTARSSRRRASRAPIPGGHGQITGGHRRLHPGRGEQPGHDPASTARCRSRSPEVAADHDQRHARRHVPAARRLLGGGDRDRPRLPVHAHLLPAAGRCWRASRSSTTRWSCSPSSGSSR